MEDKKEFYNYIVYNDGRVFSNYSNKFLKGEITVHGYLQYSLSINKKSKRFKAHRLVALLFIPNNDPHRTVVNHIDGNKLNNHYTNLEWCTYYDNNRHARDSGLNNISLSNRKRWNDEQFRVRTSKKISDTKINRESSKWKKNGRFKYLILDNFNKEYSRIDLHNILKLSQSRVDKIIHDAAAFHTSIYYNDRFFHVIDTSKGESTIENAGIREKRCQG